MNVSRALLHLASQSRVDGNGEIENRPEDGTYLALYAALSRASRRAHSPLSEYRHLHGTWQRSLTVLDNNQHVTIVAVVSVVACDDTGVSNEPGAVTGTATVRSVTRMDSYV